MLAQTTTTFDPAQLGEAAGKAVAGLWVLLAVVAILYWLPTLIAAIRGRNLGRVAVINFLVGWTVVGWVIAMVIALSKPTPVALYRPG